jgi:hypothetical protein
VLGTSDGSHYESLRFSTYHRPTGDRVSGARSLKPDLVGCDEDIKDDQTVYWRSICIPVQVNDSWSDMVAKATTYACCMFAASSGRKFALVIALHYPFNEVRLLFFHRGGLTASPAFKLEDKTGFAMFVAAMVGLASVKDQFSSGMDDSLNDSKIHLPVGGLWTVDEWLYTGTCVRGRATQVLRVSQASPVLPPRTADVDPGPSNEVERKNSIPCPETDALMHEEGQMPAAQETIQHIARCPESSTLKCHDKLDTPLVTCHPRWWSKTPGPWSIETTRRQCMQPLKACLVSP